MADGKYFSGLGMKSILCWMIFILWVETAFRVLTSHLKCNEMLLRLGADVLLLMDTLTISTSSNEMNTSDAASKISHAENHLKIYEFPEKFSF